MTQPKTPTASAEGVACASEWGLDLGAAPENAMPPIVSTQSIDDDDWLLDHKLRLLKRKLNLPDSVPPGGAEPQAGYGPAFDRATASAGTVSKPIYEPASHSAPSRNAAKRRPAILAWAIMSLGLMSFACGGVLLAWSFLGHRSDLWGLGMPITLVGQFGLLLGLVLQLEHLWQASRRTADTLHAVDDRLAEITHATTMLHTTHSMPAQSFYAHFAQGASPHLLLADLKGQLDLLSAKLSQQG